ncbi:MAG: hypothetical protein ABI837_11420, partial [Acidobacteriota bacterium]
MRRHRFALAFVAVLALAFVMVPLLRHEIFMFRDHGDYFQPLHFFTASELRAGHLPLWNPYNASGEPWLANPQTGVFYPPSLLFLILPFATAYMLYLALHLAILGWGGYALFERDAGPGPALVGAVALMTVGPTLSLLDVSNNLCTFAWFPIVLWSALTRSRLAPLFLAMAFLAGEPFFAALAAVLYAIIVRTPRLILKSGAIAAGLASAQLLPFLEMLHGSDRGARLSNAEILRDSMSVHDWLRVAVRPVTNADGFDPALAQHFIPIIYVGVAVVALAAMGCVLVRTLRTAGWLLLLLFSIAISLGPAFLGRMPLTLFRYPSRLVPIGGLALVALAVAGWQRLRPDRRWADLLLIGVIILDVVPRAAPMFVASPFDPHRVHYDESIGRDSKVARLFSGSRAQIVRERDLWISGYLNLFDHRFDAWTAAPVIAQRYVAFYSASVAQANRGLIDAMSVGWFLVAGPLPRSLFVPAKQVGRVITYSYAPAWPMTRLVTGDGRIVPGKRGEFSTSGVSFETDSPTAGLAVVAQQDAAGWHVKVDGIEQQKVLEHGIFRAVRVGAGHHRIDWRYRPWSLIAGLLVTMVTIVAQLL